MSSEKLIVLATICFVFLIPVLMIFSKETEGDKKRLRSFLLVPLIVGIYLLILWFFRLY
jgi:hypothetical protein